MSINNKDIRGGRFFFASGLNFVAFQINTMSNPVLKYGYNYTMAGDYDDKNTFYWMGMATSDNNTVSTVDFKLGSAPKWSTIYLGSAQTSKTDGDTVNYGDLVTISNWAMNPKSYSIVESFKWPPTTWYIMDPSNSKNTQSVTQGNEFHLVKAVGHDKGTILSYVPGSIAGSPMFTFQDKTDFKLYNDVGKIGPSTPNEGGGGGGGNDDDPSNSSNSSNSSSSVFGSNYTKFYMIGVVVLVVIIILAKVISTPKTVVLRPRRSINME
jgi:hypothetical protein